MSPPSARTCWRINAMFFAPSEALPETSSMTLAIFSISTATLNEASSNASNVVINGFTIKLNTKNPLAIFIMAGVFCITPSKTPASPLPISGKAVAIFFIDSIESRTKA